MRLIILLLTFVFISGCNAQEEPDCSYYSKIDNNHFWNGPIEEHSYKCFKWSDLDSLTITSIGGSKKGTAQIITDIKAYKITVIGQSYCYSACVIIVSNGNERYTNGAKFGIHLSTKGETGLYLYGEDVNKDWLLNNLHDDLYFFGTEEAFNNGIITSPVPYLLLSILNL